jgi:hypothetical protein
MRRAGPARRTARRGKGEKPGRDTRRFQRRQRRGSATRPPLRRPEIPDRRGAGRNCRNSSRCRRAGTRSAGTTLRGPQCPCCEGAFSAPAASCTDFSFIPDFAFRASSSMRQAVDGPRDPRWRQTGVQTGTSRDRSHTRKKRRRDREREDTKPSSKPPRTADRRCPVSKIHTSSFPEGHPIAVGHPTVASWGERAPEGAGGRRARHVPAAASAKRIARTTTMRAGRPRPSIRRPQLLQ